MKCGLLGRKLGHSYSPQIHSHLGSYSYELFEREPEDVGSFLKYGDFSAINVTIPYKKDVIPFLDELSPVARHMGAVNTIVRRGGKLIGHNTDNYGFSYMLQKSGLAVQGKKILVLGSGGASNTVVAVLKEAGAKVVVISRSGENNYQNLHHHADAAAIVNTTPVGMYPTPGLSPVCLDDFPNLEGVLDLIYNPARTKILMDAADRGLIAVNGLSMLVAQAKEAAEWFLQQQISDTVIEDIHTLLRASMENIILIGMPGCGKSTVGKQLAEKLGRPFFDADEELIKEAGQTIPEIFSQKGEEAFRQLETQTLARLGMGSGAVIATGGGCVTREENYRLLHQNGQILWITRDLQLLATDGRPLSQSRTAAQLWQVREPLYRRFADLHTDNNESAESAVSKILELLGR